MLVRGGDMEEGEEVEGGGEGGDILLHSLMTLRVLRCRPS